MSRQSSGRGATFCAGLSLLAVLLCSRCDGQDVATIEKSWRERSGRIKEIHLKWVERLTHHTRPGVTGEGQGELALSAGGRIRLLSDNFPDGPFGPGMRPQNPQPVTNKLTLSRQIHVYDGDTSAALYGPQQGRPHHVLGMGDGVVPNWGFVANISALEMFCRPFGSTPNALHDGLAGFQLRTEELDGAKVFVIQKDRKSFWVTADERALVVRELFTRGDTDVPSIEIRVRYSKDSDSGEWLPSGWDYKHFGVDGKFVVESRTAEVTEAYVHAPLPVDLFRLEKVPEGTYVNDQRDGKVVDYIHRSKQGPRYIPKGEFTGDNYEVLLNSEAPAGSEIPAIRPIPLARSGDSGKKK